MWNELTHAARALGRAPGFTAAAVLTLALGIGATTVISTTIQAVLLRQLPVRDASELYFVQHGTGKAASSTSTYPLYERLARRSDVFSGAAAYMGRTFKVNGGSGTELVQGQFVSGNYHSVIGVTFALGRGFATEDDRLPGGSPLAVISYGYWERRFGRRPDVIGLPLEVGGRAVTVVGVTARGFEGLDPGRPRDLTLPLSMRSLEAPGFIEATRDWVGMPIVVRVRRPAGEARAAAGALDLEASSYLSEPFNRDLVPDAVGPFSLVPASHGSAALRDRYSRALTLLAGMVTLVLLVACVNVANLQLVRGASREREMAVRLGIGATRAQAARQLLTESLLLAAGGGFLGVLLAGWGTEYIGAVLRVGRNPVVDLTPDWRVLAATGVVSLLCGIAAGLVPALRATRPSLAPALRGASMPPSAARLWGRRALVAAQFAICLALVAAAGLLMRTLQNLHLVDGGFRTERVLLLSLDGIGAPSAPGRLPSLCTALVERLTARGAAQTGACATSTPADTSFDVFRLSVPGFTPGAGSGESGVMTNAVSPGYFTALDIDIVAGRAFTDADAAGAPNVAVVSESMGRHFFGMHAPLGRTFTLAGRDITVVGVASDVRRQLRDAPVPLVYVPLSQAPARWPILTVVLHTAIEPAAIAVDVRRALADLDRQIAVDYVRTMEAQVGATLTRERLLSGLSTAFGALALILSCIGLYGVVSYEVARRTREMGIRAAVGATRGRLLRGVLEGTMLVAGAGVAAGLLLITLGGPAAMAVLGDEYLFGTTPRDPIVITLVTVALIATALLAGYTPARRAARVDPAVALRVE